MVRLDVAVRCYALVAGPNRLIRSRLFWVLSICMLSVSLHV